MDEDNAGWLDWGDGEESGEEGGWFDGWGDGDFD